MATTFYFPSTGSAPQAPAIHSAWEEGSASNFVRRPLILTTASDTNMLNHEFTISGLFNEAKCGIQYISDELEAQTISGTLDFYMMGRVSVTGVTFLALHVRVITPTGTTRGTLLDLTSSTSEAIHNAAYRWQGWGSQAISSLAVTAGDRLCIEIGFFAQNTSSKTVGLKIGDDTAVSDITSSSSSGSATRKGNIVFSDTITFAPTGSLEYDYYDETVRLGNPVTTNNSSLASGTYSLASGTLPPGVSLNTSTGAISGTPTTRGTYTVVVNRSGTGDSPSITWVVTSNIITGPIDL